MLFVELFLLSIVIYLIGLIYAIFWLKEIKVPVSSEETGENAEGTNTNGLDNMGFQDAPPPVNENKTSSTNGQNGNTPPAADIVVEEPAKKNICLDFFDPTLALACINVVRVKRENMKHWIIWFLIVSYIIIAGTAQGE